MSRRAAVQLGVALTVLSLTSVPLVAGDGERAQGPVITYEVTYDGNRHERRAQAARERQQRF